MAWEAVEEALPNAKLIAWDECHKIYLALDDEQEQWFRDSGYTIFEGTEEEKLDKLHEWFEASCFLRFINGVSTNHADPNAGFAQLISQFELDEYEDEDEDGDYDDDESAQRLWSLD